MVTEFREPAAPKVDMKGPIIGTPEGAYVTHICKAGRHEGFVDSHGCIGGFVHRGKQTTCRCACHTLARQLPPGSDFEIVYAVSKGPTEETLADELKSWSRERERSNPHAKTKPKVRDDDFNEDTGRRARGALEQQVFNVCVDYMRGGFEALAAVPEESDDDEFKQRFCDTRLIAHEVDFRYGQGMPSEGAIRAVLLRWQAAEHALIGNKPICFLVFTPKGMEIIPNKERSR